MSVSVTFLLCAFDKVSRVGMAARSILEQTGPKVDVIFSDHGSIDGTRELLRDMAGGYDGPHQVRCLDCPPSRRRGILGLNAHLAWLIPQVETDVVVFVSADDVCYPHRAVRVADTFAETNADYVITRARFFCDGVEDLSVRPAGALGTGQVLLSQLISSQAGLWNGGAFTTHLWRKYGPMVGIEAPDLILPALATEPLGHGLFMLDEFLHDSHHVADFSGVSSERAMQASVAGTPEHVQWAETNCYQFASSHFALIKRLNSLCNLNGETERLIGKKLFEAAESWITARDQLTLANIEPRGLA